jgi:Spy/CpxP family protein refolding chaperone
MFRQLCLVTAALAAIAASAAAQRGGSRNSDAQAPVYTEENVNRLDRVADYLNLSHEQRKNFKDIMDAGQKEAAPLREQMTESRAELADAIAGGKSAAEIEKANHAYAVLDARMAAIELKAFAQIFKMLDAAQQEKVRPVFVMMNGVFRNKNWMEIQ